MPYCLKQDLLTGDIPLPSYVSPEKFIQDAADEIDSQIGFLYVTPVDISDAGTTSRPVRLLLKRLNSWIATGRLLMAANAAGGEIHNYGSRLVREATASVNAIEKGQLVLEGAEKSPLSGDEQVGAPQWANVDSESNVEAFYTRVMR